MDDPVRGLYAAGRHADQMVDRQAFSIGPCDAVDRAQLADAIGSAEPRHTVDPGIAVRGIGSIELVAAADPAHVLTAADRVVEREGEITGDAKDVFDANLAQPRKDMFYYRFTHCLLLYPSRQAE